MVWWMAGWGARAPRERQAMAWAWRIPAWGAALGAGVVLLAGAAGWLDDARFGRANGTAELKIVDHSELNGRRWVTFELRVPGCKRLVITRSDLVSDWGTAVSYHGSPGWVRRDDPAGRLYEPGSRVRFRMFEPGESLRRLQFEMLEFDVGLRMRLWQAKRAWQTRSLTAFSRSPAPRGFTYLRSEIIPSDGSESGDLASGAEPVSPER